MKTKRYMQGFALLEILVATVLLCGLIYMFISFSQNQQRQLNAQSAGKQLAIAMNALVVQVAATNGKCPKDPSRTSLPLDQCIPLSDSFKNVLKSNNLDPSTATVSLGQ